MKQEAIKVSERCKSYVGVACVDGTCSVARSDDYEAYSMPAIYNCDDQNNQKKESEADDGDQSYM